MFRRFAAAALSAALALPAAAHAGEAADITRKALYEGGLEEALGGLGPLRATAGEEASFGAGLLTFVRGIERFSQALYRHGLAVPEAPDMGPPLLLPVPANPDPQPLDYLKFRAILDALVADMDAARALLDDAGAQGDYVVPLDLLKFRIDVNGDGKSEEAESLGAVIARAIGEDPSALTAPPPVPQPSDKTGRAPEAPQAPDAPQVPAAPESPAAIPEAIIGFDRADAIWLAGYTQVLAAQADFLLAHDFEGTVNATFHRLFPRAELPMQNFADHGMLMMDPRSDNAIADAIAAVHTVNWPVVEPDRLKRVLERFKTITGLSRRNWEAILAETDDNRELIPSPKQTSLIPEGQVTDEVVAAWMATLDAVDKVLAGELLVPHWRFAKGFDVRAYFETADHTDFVMLLTGYDAVPFIKDGPMITAETFAEANRVFGDNLLGYIFWFN